MNGLNKGIRKAELAVKWDPSPVGEPATDLDIIAATYPASAPQGIRPMSCTSTAGPPTAPSI